MNEGGGEWYDWQFGAKTEISRSLTSEESEQKSGLDEVVAVDGRTERGHQQLEERVTAVVDFSDGLEILQDKTFSITGKFLVDLINICLPFVHFSLQCNRYI